MVAVTNEQTTSPEITWASPEFVQSYRILDEKWLTKTALYDEIVDLLDQMAAADKPLTVLDLGGGLGTLARRAYNALGDERFASWTVYDRQRAMMQGGSTYAQPPQGLHFLQGTLDAPLPFAAESFDVVIAVNVLYLFDDHLHVRLIAPEIARVLTRGGLVIGLNPLENPNMSQVITTEVQMRAVERRQSAIRARLDVVRELFANLNFLREQRQLEANANKKAPETWNALYRRASRQRLRPVHTGLSSAYAEQAGIFVLQAK